MKKSKKRLAALAMSVMMAASVMVFPAYAEESEGEPVTEAVTTEATSETVESSENGISLLSADQGFIVDRLSAVFDNQGNVTYTMTNGNPAENYTKTATATKEILKEAACEQDRVYRWVAVVEGDVQLASGEYTEANTALQHQWEETKRQTVTAPTHFDKGQAHVWYQCSLCGAEKQEYVDLDVQEHTWGEVTYVAGDNVKADAQGHVVFDENGDPVLEDEMRDGLYYEKYFCTVDGYEDQSRTKEVRVYAKKAAYAKIIDENNIATPIVNDTKYESPTQTFPLDESSLELQDCSKDAWYVVEYYTIEDKPISREKINVSAHHYQTFLTAEFKTHDDMGQCTVVTNGDGSLTVTNKSCYLAIEYDEVTHCSAAGCPAKDHEADWESPACGNAAEVSRVTKTAEPTGTHVIKTTAKEAIAALVSRGNVLYSELKQIADVADNFVQISEQPANNCEENGTVTVSYICVVDKQTVVETQTVEVVATGHTRQPAVRENYVAPTCTSLGSYDAVIKCATCGKELERRADVKIPRIAHTNEVRVFPSGIGEPDRTTDTTAYIKLFGDKVIDWDGECLNLVGVELNQNWLSGYAQETGRSTTEFGVQALVYTNCTVCNNYEVELDNQNVKLTIVDVQKQQESGEAGYITIKASYTKQNGETIVEEYSKLPYFTTIEAYMGRVEDAPLNGLHLDEDGIFRYYVDDEFQSDFAGIVEFGGERFFVANGVLASQANGLNEYNGEWYFLSNGQIQRTHRGLAEYDGEWFYIENGKLVPTVNGLVEYDGGLFVFAEGRLCKEANGLWQDPADETWYFLSNGQVQTQHTGVAMYDGAFFYVIDGKLASDYNGTIEYDGAVFNVVAGQLYDQVA